LKSKLKTTNNGLIAPTFPRYNAVGLSERIGVCTDWKTHTCIFEKLI